MACEKGHQPKATAEAAKGADLNGIHKGSGKAKKKQGQGSGNLRRRTRAVPTPNVRSGFGFPKRRQTAGNSPQIQQIDSRNRLRQPAKPRERNYHAVLRGAPCFYPQGPDPPPVGGNFISFYRK